MRTDSGTVFKSHNYNQFCKELCIEQVVCPVRDHRGNRLVKRMIRTIKERLRTDKDIDLTQDKSKILSALRTEIGSDGITAFERHMSQKPIMPKRAFVKKFISEADPQIELISADFSEEVDSTVLFRE